MIKRRSAGGLLAVLATTGTIAVATFMSAADARVAAPTSAEATDLKTDLDAILADERLKGATAGALVQDAATGQVQYSREAVTPQLPASNQKIHTSTAALSLLGPGYRFRTKAYARQRSGSTVKGNLYLKGTGDTTMRAADYDRLAAQVAARGVKKVTGDLIADDSWFDARRTAPGWDPADLPYAYAAQISALTISPDQEFNAGSIKVTVTPGEAGRPVKVALDPPTHVVKVDNKATTGEPNSASSLAVARPDGANTIVVTGSYPSDGSPVEDLRTVEEPELYAADVFRTALARHGVKVAGQTSRGRTPREVSTLAARESMPLSQLTTPFLKLSNNVIAETLVKSIGRKAKGEGSWRAGLPAIERHLGRQGVSTERLELTDGSGLSRSNRTTPQDIATVLTKARGTSWFPAWYEALPIAGEADPMVGGTLASRMAGTPAAGNVHAKTGTLSGVTALSGYVRAPSGRQLIFSVVLNGYSGGAPKDIEDKIAVRLAGGSGSADSVKRAVTPQGTPAPGPDLECSWTKNC